MKVHYIVEVQNPEQNIIKVTCKVTNLEKSGKVSFFLPSWSPGSYMIRDYARNIRWMQVQQDNGEFLYFSQQTKNHWEIDWSRSDLKKPSTSFDIVYVIYLNELTVRTSHVNASHAFLHGPSYLIGLMNQEVKNPTIEFRFTPLWSRLSTSLKEVSGERNQFIYTAENYDELIDCPVEIGCHETDGFMSLGKPHHIANFGVIFPHKGNLKKDIQTIVETVASHFRNELPYDQYLFLTHFAPNLRGGLEHHNSTALHFDGRKLANRKEYIDYLSLVAHEYFHLWNVKRIRPRELGPFNYHVENYTTMLWLAEGLTSLMDDLFVYRAGLCSMEEYLEQVKSNLDTYYSTPGKKFHSLEQSSFNAWIKLYKPDENFRNSSISYYLKGGLVFTALHSLLVEKGKSIDDLVLKLWDHYKGRPHEGVDKNEVYDMVKELGGEEVAQIFGTMVETTEDIDFDAAFQRMGCELVWSEPKNPYLGCAWEFQGDRVIAKMVFLDSPAYKAGINPGDEMVFLNGLRFLREDLMDLTSTLEINRPYELMISRLGKLERLEIVPGTSPRTLKEIAIKDRAKAEKAFSRGGKPGPGDKTPLA